MSLHFRRSGTRIIILGRTWPHREAIKTIGGRFNGSDKTWWVPYTEKNSALVRELCVGAGGDELPAIDDPADASPTESTAEAAPEITTSLAARAVAATELPPWAPTHAADNDKANSESISVQALLERAVQVIRDGFPVPIWVTGEIEGIAIRSSGVFLELAEPRDKDADARGGKPASLTVRATIWTDALRRITQRHGEAAVREVLADGLRVRVLARVSLYRDRGQITLGIEDIDPQWTKGALALARAELLRELRAKGLDQANRRLSLPQFPLLVGLISAVGSRAESDFLHQLERGGFPGKVLYAQCPMQGDGVPGGVAQAIRALATRGCDLIVITRGGGSAADLRWFDAREIALAIAGAGVPILAAIGHHDDVSVAEEISWRREKTPTAAAQFLLDHVAGVRELLDVRQRTLASVLERGIERAQGLITGLAPRLAVAAGEGLARRTAETVNLSSALERSVTSRLSSMNINATRIAGELHGAALATINLHAEKVSQLLVSLTRTDPKPWLTAGWTRFTMGGTPVTRASALAPGNTITARLVDGLIDLSVIKVTKVPERKTNNEKPSSNKTQQ